MQRPRVLILAEQCNPLWPSLPIVGYKYALALAQHCDVKIVTQVRNRDNIVADGREVDKFDFLDTEYIAAPMERVSQFLRGGNQVAWSTGMIMAYLPYLAFERDAWKKYRTQIEGGGQSPARSICQTVSPISSRTSVRWPVIAAAAAIAGDIRCVRPPRP
jgi:hypothetical protein